MGGANTDHTTDYQGIAFGAIIFNTETFEPVEELYRELHFDDTRYKWTDKAEQIHGLSRDHLAACGVSREEALVDLLTMTTKYFGTDRLFLAGHNPGFDLAFTEQLARDHDIELVFHHVMLDTAGICQALIGINKSNEVFETLLGLKRDKHNALEDARATLQVLQTVRHIFQLGLQQL
jgi:DNA polymerase III epsilon subunit-like protein